jgi:hypothetical protein
MSAASDELTASWSRVVSEVPCYRYNVQKSILYTTIETRWSLYVTFHYLVGLLSEMLKCIILILHSLY